jgi:ABC-type transporter Mla subunit MlaD
MNENNANYAKIGFFVLTGFALILVAIGIAGARVIKRNEIFAETYIAESVTGLEIGSPVKYRGVPVGSVKRIGFLYSEYGNEMTDHDAPLYAQRILVIMALDPQQFLPMKAGNQSKFLQDLIASGLRVKVASQGLTGIASIEFDYFPATQYSNEFQTVTWKPKNVYIPSAPSTFFIFKKNTEDLIFKFNQLDLQGIATDFHDLLETTHAKIGAIDAANLSSEALQLVKELRATTQSLQKLVGSPEIQRLPTELAGALARVNKTVDNINSRIEPLMASLKGVTDRTDTLLVSLSTVTTNTGTRIDETFDMVGKTLDSFGKTLDSLGKTAQTMNRLTASQQYALTELIQNLRTTSTTLNQLITDVQANPASLIVGQPPVPLRETK